MQYRHRCSECELLFVSPKRYDARCPNHPYSTGHFVADIAEAAIDAYVAVSLFDVAGDVVSGVGDMIGGLFD